MKNIASTPTQSASFAHPVTWLKQLTHLQPAAWNWPRSLRSALGISLPLIIGLLTNQLDLYLWVSLGFMLQISSERDNPYQVIFLRMLIITPLAMLGMMLGYLSSLPWEVVTLCMTLLAFLSAILSSYTSALSIGTMQMIMLGTISVSTSSGGHYYQSALLLLASSLFYAFMLAIEALLSRRSQEAEYSHQILLSLATLADAKAKGQDTELIAQKFSNLMSSLYTLMFHTRSLSPGRSISSEHIAATLQHCDNLFAAIIGSEDSNALHALSQRLTLCAQAYYRTPQALPSGLISQTQDGLEGYLNTLITTLWEKPGSRLLTQLHITLFNPRTTTRKRFWAFVGELSPGKEVLLTASALALCTFIAYNLRWKDNYDHWYWIPMTVILVMKPDMGSVFARTALRCIGTSAGVVIGGLILYFVPSGPVFILFMAVLAALLPWAAQRNYAFMCLFLTPLVLVLLEYVIPLHISIDYAVLRLIDTFIGSAIALFFGYIIWPNKSRHKHFSDSFQALRSTLANYLRTLLEEPEGKDESAIHRARHAAYAQLADLRSSLQKQLSDPPAASQEALSWFPLIAGAARINNAITTYSIQPHTPCSPHDKQLLQLLADLIEHGHPEQIPNENWSSDQPGSKQEQLINTALNELRHAGGLVAIHPSPTLTTGA